jgi:hypothetical protein
VSTAQNFAYAAIQVAHNLGAVTTVGSSLAGALIGNNAIRRSLVRFLLTGWAIQVVSGITFGVTSFYFYGHLPDIAGSALLALYVKIFCVVTGFFVVGVALSAPPEKSTDWIWPVSAALAITALTAAAFLRWFS